MALDPKRVQKPARKLRKLLKKMPSVPAPEEIHGFRTNARRLETVLDTFALDNTRNGSRLSKHISKLRKRAGKVRDFDVLTDYASGIDHDSSERECSVRLLEHLGAQRDRQARKFHNLQKRYSSVLRKELKRTSNKLDDIFPPHGDGRLNGESACATAAASALTVLSDLTQPSQLRKSNLHEYRLKVKELQNVLQMAENADHQAFVHRLGDVKDAIGEWHDWEVLVATAHDTLDHGQNCEFVNQLRNMAAMKFEKALQLSRNMRREYLHMTRHHRKGSSLVPRPAEAVWSATASLVA